MRRVASEESVIVSIHSSAYPVDSLLPGCDGELVLAEADKQVECRSRTLVVLCDGNQST